MRGRAAPKRAAWGLADQAFSSLTNFGLTAVVARAVSPREFGAFALIFATYLLILGISRALSTLPLLVRFSAVDDAEWRRATASATGTALIVGGVAALVCAVGGMLLANTRGALLGLAVAAPGLMLQEAWRHAFIARGIPRQAVLNDLVWTIVLIPALAVPIALDATGAGPFVLAWGGSGAAAGLLGMAQARLLPAPRDAVRWIRTHWDLAGRQLGEFGAIVGANQSVLYVVGAVVGVAGAGAIRGAHVLLGPLTVGLQGIWIVGISELVRKLKRDPAGFVRASVGLSALLGAGAILYVAVFVAAGDRVGPFLLGDTWTLTRSVFVPLGLWGVAWALWLGATVGLRALQEARRSLHCRIATSIMTLAGGTMGVLAGGVRGAAWGIGSAALLGVVVWWRSFIAALSDGALGRAAIADVDPALEESVVEGQ